MKTMLYIKPKSNIAPMIYRYLLIALFAVFIVGAEEYSYEKAEELTPLIEWREYGPGSFEEAKDHNKPIFLLLTAPSWCYWCQVYESEDYLFHPDMVEYINQYTIPIYVDADQRYDLTRQYLEGGWPSTTILTPDNQRLHGYSGPRPVENMLANLKNAVEYVNSNVAVYDYSYEYKEEEINIPSKTQLVNLIESYASYNTKIYDPENGGFGNGQKFPQGRTLDFFLDIYELTDDPVWLEMVQNTLRNQYTSIDHLETDYNLFDSVEGGFHRYGTAIDWTPPHYEKMLYDNARLLKTYFHLNVIAPDDLAAEVVEKTDSYIDEYWFDDVNGGFYGNSDVHGEDEYYAKNPRPDEKPRVEKTKYTNWNAEAILTYLYMYEVSGDNGHKEKAEQSLDFYRGEITTDGAYHYAKSDEKAVRGNLVDNSYLLLAFIEGYRVFGDEKYLLASKQLAGYSLNNLYDWKSGGFFERNSPDKDLYAPGEHVRLSKPIEENSIMSFALIKLYLQTNEPVYLNAAIKTMGNQIDSVGGLDSGYYFIKASQSVVENNLISKYQNFSSEIKDMEDDALDDYWLDELLNKSDFEVSNQGLEKIEASIVLLIFVAIIAGFISFASPCTLPIIPAFVAYLFSSSKKNLKGMTIAFFLGLSTLFTMLGMGASIIGSFLREHIDLFSGIAGIAMMLFGAFIIAGGGFRGIQIKHDRPTSYIGSFMVGVIIGISWTPCVGPILVAILLLASTTGSVLTGGLLLLMYSFGFAIPILVITLYLKKVNTKSRIWKFIKGREVRIFNLKLHSSSLISGLIFLILGYLIFSGKLLVFNQFLGGTGLQKIIILIEDFILGLI